MIEWTFLLLLGIYLAIISLIGFVNRRTASLSDFFLASRSLSSNSVGLSLGATVVGGSAVIVTASLVHTYGLAGLWYDIGAILGLILLGLWLAPKVRRTGAHSLPDLIGLSYGRIGRTTSSVLLVAVEMGWIALLLQASEFILSAASGLDSGLSLLLVTVVLIGYTAFGGHLAVVRTDKVQISLVIFALLTILFALISNGATIPSGGLRFPTSAGFGPSLAISALSVMFLSNLVGPDIYSKLFSARGPSEAGRGALTAGLIRLLVSVVVASIALLGLSYFGSGVSGGSVLPLAAIDLLPPIMAYVVLLGLISIMLSSADSCLISGATFLSWDLIGSHRKWTRYLTVVLLGAGSYLLAFQSPGIISTLNLTYTVFAASMVPAILLSFWKDRLGINTFGAMASFLVGSSGVVVLYILQLIGMFEGSLLFIPMGLSASSLFLFSRTFRIWEKIVNSKFKI